MQAVTYTAFRQNLKQHMRSARDDADTILVTNNDPSENVVVMSQRDYESLMETVRVYENPYLRDKLDRGMAQVARGGVSVHDLIDVDDD
ncbi:MAG: type II toxin-antitoxin system Phd/YefM family antitoxin [Atopobiaceae bacterium]|nr:type II toxin-antitoxin system Phd/YefM family antitoxin [Atopobiaceae bacterium]